MHQGALHRGVAAQVEIESNCLKRFTILQLQALCSRQFRGFDRVNLHRLTAAWSAGGLHSNEPVSGAKSKKEPRPPKKLSVSGKSELKDASSALSGLAKHSCFTPKCSGVSWICKQNLKAVNQYLSFKRLDLGAFNVGLIGSTCTALPKSSRRASMARVGMGA